MISTIDQLTDRYPEVSINHETRVIRMSREAFLALDAYESSSPTNPSDGRIWRTGKSAYIARRDSARPGTYDTWYYLVEATDDWPEPAAEPNVQFVELDTHDLMYAICGYAKKKAGIPPEVDIKASIAAMVLNDGKPRRATVKFTVPPQEPVVEEPEEPVAADPGEADFPGAMEILETAQRAGEAAWDLLKAVPYALMTDEMRAVLMPPNRYDRREVFNHWRKSLHELTMMVSEQEVAINALREADEQLSGWPGQIVTLARCIGSLLADYQRLLDEANERARHPVFITPPEVNWDPEVMRKIFGFAETSKLRFEAGASIEDLKEHAPELYEAIMAANANVYASLMDPAAVPMAGPRLPVTWTTTRDRGPVNFDIEPDEPEIEHHVATGRRSIMFMGAVQRARHEAGLDVTDEQFEAEQALERAKVKPQTFIPPTTAAWGSIHVLVHQITSDGIAHIEVAGGERKRVPLDDIDLR